MTKVIEGRVGAWAAHCDPRTILEAEGDAAVAVITFSNSDMSTYSGWVKVGEARIEVALFDYEAVAKDAIASLEARAQEIRAEAGGKLTEIAAAIGKWQALEYKA
jgi:hypothetical protein